MKYKVLVATAAILTFCTVTYLYYPGKIENLIYSPEELTNASVTIRKEDLSEALKDLQKNLTQASIKIFKDKDKVIGYQFTRIDNPSLFQKAGFKVGDIILSINDFNLQSPSSAMQLYTDLRNSESPYKITLLRNSKEISYLVHVK